MTGTKNIPIKKLLLHISNVINVCDLSSVTPKRVKQYLMYRFKNTLPSEDDLDTILENVINSVKLSQALNGGSVHFQKVNNDSLNAYEANLKATVVESETKDPPIEDQDNYVPTKEGLSKERIINSRIKRVNCYATKNLFNSNQKKNGLQDSVWELSPAEETLQLLDRPAEVLQEKTNPPRKKPTEVLQENTNRPGKVLKPTKVLQKKTKRSGNAVKPAKKKKTKRSRKAVRITEQLSQNRMNDNSTWNSERKGELKLCLKRSSLVNGTKNVSKRKILKLSPVKEKNTQTGSKVPQFVNDRVTRSNVARSYGDMFSHQLSPSQIKDVIKKSKDHLDALSELLELNNK